MILMGTLPGTNVASCGAPGGGMAVRQAVKWPAHTNTGQHVAQVQVRLLWLPRRRCCRLSAAVTACHPCLPRQPSEVVRVLQLGEEEQQHQQHQREEQ